MSPHSLTLCAWSVSQLLTHYVTQLSSCVLDILSRRMLWQYQKLCWSPKRLCVLAFLDWLGGLPFSRRFDNQDLPFMKPCWPGPMIELSSRCFHYLTEKPFLCIWIWGAVFVQVSVGKTCTLNLNVFMDMRRFHLNSRIGSCLQLSVLCFSWTLKLSYC